MKNCIFFSLWIVFCSFCQAEDKGLETVPFVDLKRYAGKWYEIARMPNRWQTECRANTTATYRLNEDGTLHVINVCEIDENRPEKQQAEGTAWIVDTQTNAKLKLSFVSIPLLQKIATGDYWIILLAPDYSYSVVSEPSQTYLWILSRTPILPEKTYQNILKEIAVKAPKIDLTKLIRTIQHPHQNEPAQPNSTDKSSLTNDQKDKQPIKQNE